MSKIYIQFIYGYFGRLKTSCKNYLFYIHFVLHNYLYLLYISKYICIIERYLNDTGLSLFYSYIVQYGIYIINITTIITFLFIYTMYTIFQM